VRGRVLRYHARMSDAITFTPARTDIGAVSVYFGHKNGKYPDGNQVIVRGAEMRVAFDTPLVSNHIGADFDGVDMVILGHVHEDHMAGLHRVPKAQVWVHEADAAAARSWPGLATHYGYPGSTGERLRQKIEAQFHYRPRPDAQTYPNGHVWELGGGVRVSAHHLPGHTSGHCALVVEPAGVAFIGDIDLTGFGPYYGDATSNLADFRRTLEKVKDLPVTQWITSHHRGLISDRASFLQMLEAFAAKLDERSDKLLNMLRPGPRTLDELVAERLLYPPGYEEIWVDDAERRTIDQHLQELIGSGQVRLLGAGAAAAYALA